LRGLPAFAAVATGRREVSSAGLPPGFRRSKAPGGARCDGARIAGYAGV